MAEYLVIRLDTAGGSIVGRIEVDVGRTALSVLSTTTDYALSLVDLRLIERMAALLNTTPADAVARLGLANETATHYSALVLAGEGVDHLQTPLQGAARRLLTVGDYALWQVTSNAHNLRALHAELWNQPPAQTLGLLAVVQQFGQTFYPALARNTLEMPPAAALARRDRIATYLEGRGFSNTAALRAATTEHALVAGLATALGRTLPQLWSAMENPLWTAMEGTLRAE